MFCVISNWLWQVISLCMPSADFDLLEKANRVHTTLWLLLLILQLHLKRQIITFQWAYFLIYWDSPDPVFMGWALWDYMSNRFSFNCLNMNFNLILSWMALSPSTVARGCHTHSYCRVICDRSPSKSQRTRLSKIKATILVNPSTAHYIPTVNYNMQFIQVLDGVIQSYV